MLQYWDIMAVHEGARYNNSERCLDRSSLAEKFARKPPSDSSSVSMSKKAESRSSQSSGQKAAWMSMKPYTGELVSTQPKRPAPPRPMDMDIDRRAFRRSKHIHVIGARHRVIYYLFINHCLIVISS